MNKTSTTVSPSPAHKDAIGLCLICNELSFGKHYGCLSCLGCKTFFRRAVMHGQDTVCKKPGLCEQETSARRLCRSCRFRRCLEMGMSREALQPKRDLIGRQKRRQQQPRYTQSAQQRVFCTSATIASTSTNGNNEGQTIITIKSMQTVPQQQNGFGGDGLLELMASLTATDKAIRARKFELIRARTEAKRLADVAKQGPQIVQSQDTMMKIVLSCDLCNVTQIEMLSMFEWIQTLPDFNVLPLADRMLLLKRFAMPCNTLEYGYFTAQIGLDDVWLISNGTCMPRSVNVLPDESKTLISEDRKWRQEKLYKQMTDRCIDEVSAPLRRLQLSPEELVTLKILLLFSCGTHTQHEDSTAFISDESRRVALRWKNRVIAALFMFYKSNGHKSYPGQSKVETYNKFDILKSASATLSYSFRESSSATLESYQIMRLFKFARFDRISEQLLFDVDAN